MWGGASPSRVLCCTRVHSGSTTKNIYGAELTGGAEPRAEPDARGNDAKQHAHARRVPRRCDNHGKLALRGGACVLEFDKLRDSWIQFIGANLLVDLEVARMPGRPGSSSGFIV